MIESNEKYAWKPKMFKKCLSYLYEAEKVLCKRHDDNSQEEKHREVVFLMDRISDRFAGWVDVNKVEPAKTGWPPSVLLKSIIGSASVRYITDLNGEKY